MGDIKMQNLPREIEKEVEPRAREMARQKMGIEKGKEPIGFCHTVWTCKKQILMEDYGIDWKTPEELNPGCLFD